MALLWIDGFDTYANSGSSIDSLMTSEGYQFSGGVSVTNQTASGQGMAISTGLRLGGLQWVTTPQSQIITGFRFKYTQGAAGQLLFFIDSATQQGVTVGFTANGNITAAQGATTYGPTIGTIISSTGNNTVYPNTWYYLECSVIPATGFFEIKLNGTTLITGTNASFVFGYIDRLIFTTAQNNSSLSIFIDDWYVLNTSGGLSGSLGDHVVVTQQPAADASPNAQAQTGGGTGHFTTQDTVINDNNYLTATSSGQEELYSLSTLSSSVVGVTAAQLHVRAKADSAGWHEELIAVGPASGTTTATNALTTSFASSDLIMENGPDGSWTVSQANGLKIGFQSA
jgi:hypothetical protein